MHVKMILVEIIPRIGGRRINESGGGSEFKYIRYIIRTFVNDTMYLHPAQQRKKINVL
jgi:hypothetical protein